MDLHEIAACSFEVTPLKEWFLRHKRPLPWRSTRDPYAIWVSEIMLQQTQVVTVIPYFYRWMERFPTLSDLAHASLDEVIKMWEGLGYYSRARHLHEAAQSLVARHLSQLPETEEELKKIKGLGPYTVGALLSFAFHQKKAAVDGNVIRVLSRYFGIEADITQAKTVQRIRQLADALLPDEEPWIISEALIELGATVCQKKARCLECPLKRGCHSRRLGKTEAIPYRSKKSKSEKLFRTVALIKRKGHLLVRRQVSALMKDLHEFPYFEHQGEEKHPFNAAAAIYQRFSLSVKEEGQLPALTHGFTKYRAELYPTLFLCDDALDAFSSDCSEGFSWLPYETVTRLAFSSGHRRILQLAADWLQQV